MILVFFLLSAVSHSIWGHPVITISGDVHKNVKFFSEVFPFLMDNLGGFLSIHYNLLGSGVYSVPQMCALNQISSNNFLQAQFLQCEATEKPTETCLCQAGIDPNSYRICVKTRGYLAKESYLRFSSRYSSDVTPVVEFGLTWNITEDQEPQIYFDKLCSLFGKRQPFACQNPLPLGNAHKGAVTFDCNKPTPSGLRYSGLGAQDISSHMDDYKSGKGNYYPAKKRSRNSNTYYNNHYQHSYKGWS